MQFEKIEGRSFWTGISVKGWRRIGQVKRYKKERNIEIVFKKYSDKWLNTVGKN